MEKNKHTNESKNWLEWGITLISGVLVVFVLGFLVYQMIYEKETPPNITVVLGTVSQKDNAYAIPVEVTNKGTQTAENVIIEIIHDDGSQEISQITFPYLPRQSSADGWVVFSENPNLENLKIHVLGYGVP